jgi:hypothetical protein
MPERDADVPFLFWLPLIVLNGLLSVAADSAQRIEPERKK